MKRAAGAASPALLFAVSAAICRRLFFTDYLSHMGSVDGSYIAMARYTMRHWGDLAWWPIWFAGMPFQNVYGPVSHLVAAALAALAHQSPGWALHTLAALLYCLGPVTLWWAALRLSAPGSTGGLAAGRDSRIWALAAALLFAVTSPAAWLIPSIRADVGGILHLRRLHTMVMYGEYPHVAALTLIPLLLVAFDRMLRGRGPMSIVIAAILLAVIGCTSVTGSVGFAMVAVAWLLALRAPDAARVLPRLGMAVGLAYALALPWIPPSTLRLIWLNSQWGTGRPTPFTLRHLLYFAVIALAAAGLRVAMGRWGAPLLLRLSILLIFFSGVVMAADLSSRTALLPQPYRFHLEFEMGCCLAGGFLWLKTAARLPTRLHAALAAALVLALTAINAAHAGRYIQPADIRGTLEYQSALWFDRNMAGGRVFAPGSVSFWMNAFTDTPQLGGCCDQGVPSWEERVALYSVYSGQNMGAREAAVSLLWLQAFSVQAVEVGGPHGREFFKPYRNPRKFDGLLPVLWRDGDDVIYRVPQRSASLAHVMRESEVVSIAGRPKDGLDIAPLERYVAALDRPAEMNWAGQSRARILATASPDEVISVQVSYDRGWRARANGTQIPVTSDGLGLMVLHPHCAGPCSIDLEYDGGREMRIAQAARLAAVLAIVMLWATAPLRSRLRGRPHSEPRP
ncbi:MAG TPA: hypothetical protein VLW65_16585 [Bryobacteraceae bacterium]|nr:hypothetical protein [Bryobacteraceae bacterium]